MTVETATHVSDLNASYPAAGDPKSEGDDHIRLVKTVVKTDVSTISASLSTVVAANANVSTSLGNVSTSLTAVSSVATLASSAASTAQSGVTSVATSLSTTTSTVTAVSSAVAAGPTKARVSAYRSAALSPTSTSEIVFDAEDYDSGGDFSTSTGRFTAPRTGYYQVSAGLKTSYVSWTAVASFYTQLKKNGTTIYTGHVDTMSVSASKEACSTLNTSVYLTAGDYISIYIVHGYGSGVQLDVGSTRCQTFCVNEL